MALIGAVLVYAVNMKDASPPSATPTPIPTKNDTQAAVHYNPPPTVAPSKAAQPSQNASSIKVNSNTHTTPNKPPSKTQINWNGYCQSNNLTGCANATEETQVDTLLALINGSMVSQATSPAMAANMLQYYPQSEYERFGCANTSAMITMPGYWQSGSYVWVQPITKQNINFSDNTSTEFYWVNLTNNTAIPYLYNDSGNNTWNCSWYQTNFTPIIEPIKIDCSIAAKQDFDAWCYLMDTSGEDINCAAMSQSVIANEEAILATGQQSAQWKCAHHQAND